MNLLVAERDARGRASADLDAVMSSNHDLGHLGGNGVAAVAREAIDAGADQKMRAGIMRGTEELVNVVFAIHDMNEPFCPPWPAGTG